MEMSSKNQIMKRLKNSLGVSGTDRSRKDMIQSRISDSKAGTRPAFANLSKAKRIDLFTSILETNSAQVERTTKKSEIGKIVSDYLKAHNLPAKIKCGQDPILKTAKLESSKTLQIETGPAVERDMASLSVAKTASCETGTLFLTSGEDNPTSLNFLPETHIIVIEAGTIEASYEDCWTHIRTAYGKGNMPRTVNLISGPSRTADIEQTIEMGAHGPRRLLTIILG